jgi:hypothetical protein
MVLSTVTVVACLALGVDLGRVALAKQQLQNIADAAAQAGVIAMRSGGMTTSVGVTAAQQLAAANKVLGKSITLASTDIVVGAWDPVAKTVTPWDVGTSGAPSNLGGYVGVQVTARLTSASSNGALSASFSRIVGINSFNVTAIGIAGLTIQQMSRSVVELTMLLDFSNSFQQEFPSAVTACGALATAVKPIALPGTSSGLGDKMAYYGFSDQPIDSTNYPQYPSGSTTVGWGTDKVKNTGTWSQALGTYNYPLTLTRMDTSTTANTVINKFTGSTPIFRFGFSAVKYYNSHWYGGATNTSAGLLATAAAYKSGSNWINPNARHVIVLITDGMPYYYNSSGQFDTAASQSAATAAANTLAAQGFVIHTITLCQDSGGTTYGESGSDADFNASLVRNGGYAFRSANAAQLLDMVVGGVGSIEYGRAHLLK